MGDRGGTVEAPWRDRGGTVVSAKTNGVPRPEGLVSPTAVPHVLVVQRFCDDGCGYGGAHISRSIGGAPVLTLTG